jgi:hypothetical protein
MIGIALRRGMLSSRVVKSAFGGWQAGLDPGVGELRSLRNSMRIFQVALKLYF